MRIARLGILVLVFTVIFQPFASTAINFSSAEEVNCDWPCFGQNLQGDRVAPDGCGPMTDELALKWSFQTKGKILSSPIHGAGNIFIRTDEDLLYCVDGETGKEKWKAELDTVDEETIRSSYSSACIYGKWVFIGSFDGKMHCYNTDTGKRKWMKSTGGAIWSSPVVYKGRLFFGSSDKRFYCCSIESGSLEWSVVADQAFYSSPTFYGNNLYVGNMSGDLFCYDVRNGNKVWEFNAGRGANIESTPTVYYGKIFIGTKKGSVFCVNAEDGKPIWEFKTTRSQIYSSATVEYGKVFITASDQKLYCLNIDDGTLLWEVYTKQDKKISGSTPVLFNDKLVYTSTDNKLYMLDINTGKELWNYQIPDSAYGTHPTVGKDCVYLSSFNKTLYCFIDSKPYIPPEPTKIEISSASTKLDLCMDLQFTAKVFDQYGQVIDKAKIEWDSTDISVGEIDAAGLFKPKSYGKTKIFCRSGNLSESVEISVVPFLEVDRESVKFDNIKPNEQYIEKLIYTNTGDIDLEVSLVKDFEKLQIEPDKFTIPAGKTQEVKLIYNSKEFVVGQKFEFKLRANYLTCIVEVEGAIVSVSSIPCITANLSSLDFGLVNRGDKKDIKINFISSEPTDVTITTADPWISLSKNRFALDANPVTVTFTVMASALPASTKLISEIVVTPDRNTCTKLTIPVTVETQDSITIKLQVSNTSASINGIERTLTRPPIIDKGRVMVPLRFISEAFGCQLDWNSSERKISVNRYDVNFTLWIDKKIALINGREVQIDAPPINVSGSVMVPLRFIAEPFGAKVEWNAENKMITITWPKV